MNAVNGYRYNHRYQRTGYRHYLADPNGLLLPGLWSDLLHINIHRKHSTQSIQCRPDSTDKGSCQYSQYQPDHSNRE